MASAITYPYPASAVPNKPSTKINAALWTVQALLAALFVFAGGMKLIMPLAALEQQAHMSGLFLRFIGVCEVLGAFGLVLPGIFRVRTSLTALAASGLVVIMIGATTITLATASVSAAIMPFVVGVLSALVAYGRRKVSDGQSALARA